MNPIRNVLEDSRTFGKIREQSSNARDLLTDTIVYPTHGEFLTPWTLNATAANLGI
jgi:hypothetical protein